jgi:hypothetical protein
MIAGADEPATLSGLCQPMAIAMVSELKPSVHGNCYCNGDARRLGNPGRRPFEVTNEAPPGKSERQAGCSKVGDGLQINRSVEAVVVEDGDQRLQRSGNDIQQQWWSKGGEMRRGDTRRGEVRAEKRGETGVRVWSV